jgi:uncharacterized membrane protein YesL
MMSKIIDWLTEGFHNLAELILINFLWFILTILVVTGPPAAAGLFYATNQLAHDKPIGWRTYFEGFRTYFWLSWRWGLMVLLVSAVLVSNYLFYRRFDASWSTWVQGLFVGLCIFWGLLNLYTFPLLLEQTDRRLSVALRNSLVMYIQRPLLSLGIAGLIILVALVSARYFFPLWILLIGSLSAYLANRVTVDTVTQISALDSPVDGESS